MRKLWHLTNFLLLLLCVSQVQAEIAFLSDRDGKSDIYVMNDHGGNIRRLTDTPFTQLDLAWSPDGTQIAFATDLSSAEKGKPQQVDIFLMNADGGRQQNLTEHPALDVDPSWSPDGKFIAFASGRDGGLDIYTIEIKTRKVRRLTHNTYSINPQWSPNGKYIVYEHILPGRGRHIFFMNSDGSHERQLLRKLRHPQFGDTTIFSFNPQWAPDSEHVLYKESEFRSGVGRKANTVIVVDKHGRTPKILKIPQKWKVDAVCWTDNGEAVLFAAVPNGLTNGIDIFDIYKYRLSNGQITNLTHHPSDNWGMDWTPHNSLSVSASEKIATQWARLKADD